MVFIVIAVVAGSLTLSSVRLMVELFATIIGIVLVVQQCRTARVILAARSDNVAQPHDLDHKPRRAERRALTQGLRTAIRLTELTSLFPTVAYRARRIVDASGY